MAKQRNLQRPLLVTHGSTPITETPQPVNAPCESHASPSSPTVSRAGGHLAALRDSDGGTTSYGYDPVGRLTGIWAPSGDTVTMSYDPGGRLTETAFPNGARARYDYNADNTLKQVVNLSNVGGYEISVATPLGRRVADIVVKAGGMYRGLEIKVGGAIETTMQRAKYVWINPFSGPSGAPATGARATNAEIDFISSMTTTHVSLP